jgi:hypothetical protein
MLSSNMSNSKPESNTDNVSPTYSSSSIVLANIISEETSEWKDTIQSFIQTKTLCFSQRPYSSC